VATPRKNRSKVGYIRSVNDQPHARRPFAFNHRAKVLQMPRALGRSERGDLRPASVDDGLFDTDRFAWALGIAGLDCEQYEAMLAVRDSFATSLAIPSGMD
jgi:hypothetical protein